MRLSKPALAALAAALAAGCVLLAPVDEQREQLANAGEGGTLPPGAQGEGGVIGFPPDRPFLEVVRGEQLLAVAPGVTGKRVTVQLRWSGTPAALVTLQPPANPEGLTVTSEEVMPWRVGAQGKTVALTLGAQSATARLGERAYELVARNDAGDEVARVALPLRVGGAPGTLDATYGNLGVALTPPADGSSGWEAIALSLQDDGRALLAGNMISGDIRPMVARFTPLGALDTASFAMPNGYKRLDKTADGFVAALAVEGTSVFAIGERGGSANLGQGMFIAKLNARGDEATGFDTGDGDYFLAPGGNPQAGFSGGIWDASSSSLVVAGFRKAPAAVSSSQATQVVVARYNGAGGQLQFRDVPVGDRVRTGGLAVSGQMTYVAAELAVAPATTFAVVAVGPAGLDASFGPGGLARVNTPRRDRATDVIVQPDGKIVACGTIDDHVAVVRFLADGKPDLGFGSNGIRKLDDHLGVASDLVLAGDDILVAATIFLTAPTSDPRAAVLRLLPDGTLDPRFGAGGITVLQGEGGAALSSTAQALAVYPGAGRVLLVGQRGISGQANVMLARLWL